MSTLNTKNLLRNNALDGFRGFGCLLVLFGHTQWQGTTILPGAAIAMDLFFVLSGFLISGLLITEFDKTNDISFKEFWIRRAIRLLPVFYVYFFFVTLVYFISRFQLIVGNNPTYSLISTAFYGSNWIMAKGYEMGVFAVTWSLSLEEQFYFICPILYFTGLKFFGKRKLLLTLILLVIGINLHRYFMYQELLPILGVKLAFKRCFYGLDTHADSLLIGCVTSIVYHLYGSRFKIQFPLALVAAFLFFGTVFFVRNFPLAYHISEASFFSNFLINGGFTFYAIIGSILVVHLIQQPQSIITKFFSFNLFVKIGLMSYSIYLWHTTVFGGLEILLKSMNQSTFLWIIKTIIRFTTAIGLGYLSFKYIELPILKNLYNKKKHSAIN